MPSFKFAPFRFLVVLGVVSLAGYAHGQGCTAARGCPTLPPSMPGGSLGGSSSSFLDISAPDFTRLAAMQPESTGFSSSPSSSSDTDGVAADRARIRVNVPSQDAKIWFQGVSTEKVGTSRLFLSPELASGRSFSYLVRCSWTEENRENVRQQRIVVQAGRETLVDFAAGR